MILTFDDCVKIIQDNTVICSSIQNARKEHNELSALITGRNFDKELINKIEHIESEEKQKSRKKYSRPIIDFFERLKLPISNIFTSTGSVRKYDFRSEKIYDDFINTISKLKDGKSLTKYIQDVCLDLYHVDPNGLFFIEYSTENNKFEVYPTYKSINCIRYYESKGQLTEYVLFEPEHIEGGKLSWRLVDDLVDYRIIQDGDYFTIDESKTFTHPFGEPPAIIISDIVDSCDDDLRKSPFSIIVPLSKEIARDTSIKTLYKFLHGFPTHWRYVTMCRKCNGVGKVNGKSCEECDGHGYYKKKDVTDIVTLPIPTESGMKLAPDIAGYISPDLETWNQYTTEIELLEKLAYQTIWGTTFEKGSNETATGRFIDTQPVTAKLNRYADYCEFIEWKITEFIANFIDNSKAKDEFVSTVLYGRRFIIVSPDILLENYYKAKTQNANNIILDRLLNEYVTSKYINDIDLLKEELVKISIEPYVHLSISEVNSIFGRQEALKKNYFSDWWSDNKYLLDNGKDEEFLTNKFETDYNNYKLKQNDSNL
jgi:hypothetical protein